MPEVRILLYATAREAVGRPLLTWPTPPDGLTAAELLESLCRAHPKLIPVLPTCRIARNGRYIPDRSTPLKPGDELAIHPPFSGG